MVSRGQRTAAAFTVQTSGTRLFLTIVAAHSTSGPPSEPAGLCGKGQARRSCVVLCSSGLFRPAREPSTGAVDNLCHGIVPETVVLASIGTTVRRPTSVLASGHSLMSGASLADEAENRGCSRIFASRITADLRGSRQPPGRRCSRRSGGTVSTILGSILSARISEPEQSASRAGALLLPVSTMKPRQPNQERNVG